MKTFALAALAALSIAAPAMAQQWNIQPSPFGRQFGSTITPVQPGPSYQVQPSPFGPQFGHTIQGSDGSRCTVTPSPFGAQFGSQMNCN